jgi:hypothetical protein
MPHLQLQRSCQVLQNGQSVQFVAQVWSSLKALTPAPEGRP